ncbi:ABC transporter ATP-binding protein [Natronoarchaeum sp. GCM10025321]|uniref:ABC transporter ATP-binding protein n=1 Tax=Natronoarchaeum sp. GCM10025321 TaxID=3252684 RepID=UPI00360A7B91
MTDSTVAETDSHSDTAVSVQQVVKTYYVGQPVHALDDVTFELPRGSYTAVMGPSGSGKSTLMNLIGCLDTPTEGTVVVNSQDVTSLSDRERTRLRGEEIGFVFQTFNLMPRLTALQNVALPMVARNVSRDRRVERAQSLLGRVGLADRVDHLPNELSGGQRQRVAIARALVNDPTLLLADEPTGNVDTDTGATIMNLFAELHAAGNTLLVVTHERRIAEHADRILHLLDGELERIERIETPRRPTVDSGEGD